jgi:haloalkane dehalogenase
MVNGGVVPDWLKGEYPFAPQTWVTPAGARLRYVDEGPRDAEAVVMLHGNPTWSFHYRHLVRALAPAMRCIVPDHVGMGLSDKPQDYEYTLARRIDDIAGLVAALGLKRIHLVVHDWGGAIGFGFALRQLESVGRIVILNTAAFPSKEIPRRIAFCRQPVLGPFLVRRLNAFARPATWMAMDRRKLSPLEKRAYLWPYRSWANRVAVNAFVQDIPMEPGHPSWSTLNHIGEGLPRFARHDVLLVWGGMDFCFNDLFLWKWRQILPKAGMFRVPDAGHYVLEDAREQCLGWITPFLRGQP